MRQQVQHEVIEARLSPTQERLAAYLREPRTAAEIRHRFDVKPSTARVMIAQLKRKVSLRIYKQKGNTRYQVIED
jgi:DNA-binding MarR family transcriptional regulator